MRDATTTEQFPEHEKLHAIKDESQAIGAFLDYSGYTLCEIMYHAPHNGPGGLSREPNDNDSSGSYYPVMKSIEQILADYFDIDRDKLEAEKQQMLEMLREANAQ